MEVSPELSRMTDLSRMTSPEKELLNVCVARSERPTKRTRKAPQNAIEAKRRKIFKSSNHIKGSLMLCNQ